MRDDEAKPPRVPGDPPRRWPPEIGDVYDGATVTGIERMPGRRRLWLSDGRKKELER